MRAYSAGRVKPLQVLVCSVVSAVLCLAAAAAAWAPARQAEATDWTQWIMCNALPDPAPKVYQLTQSKDLQFELRSKSAVSSGIYPVDGGLNWLLEASGSDFKAVNEAVLGYSLDPQAPDSGTQTGAAGGKEPPNGGPQVNPFDRFGVAGMGFSAYQGEWKYFVIDACKEGGEVNDPKAGLFYEGRLETRSGWEEAGASSKDVRARQFSHNPVSTVGVSALNRVANWTFTLTKLVVVLTIAFMNFAFADLAEVLGFKDLVTGDSGLFTTLFDGLFTPLVSLAFLATGVHLLVAGALRRKHREAFEGVVRSLLLFVTAIGLSLAPGKWITIPNDLAVGVQAVIVASMDQSLNGGEGMCATDIGQVKSDLAVKSGHDEASDLAKTSQNIRSVMGCKLWHALLLRPWTEGQWGKDYNQLWAKDKIPAWAPAGAAALGNLNGQTVGDASVPLGGGASVSNWALFQMSAQTDAHWAADGSGKRQPPVNGVAGDWYRVVDAVANYDEKEVVENTQVNASGDHDSLKYQDSAQNPPLPEWDTWVGNSMKSRFTASLSSLVVAAVGVSAPLVLSAMTSMYTIGISLLLGFAPLFLLLGCWANRGWEICKGWAELLLNTFLSRIMAGLLLVVAVILVSNALDATSSLGWWQSVALVAIISLVLIRSRHHLIAMAAGFRFSQFDMAPGASASVSRAAQAAKAPLAAARSGARFSQVALAGGLASVHSGGSLWTGVKAGLKQEAESLAYRNKHLRPAVQSWEVHASNRGSDILADERNCAQCGKDLDYELDELGTQVFEGGRDSAGNLICLECFEDGVDPGAQAITFVRNKPRRQQTLEDERRMKIAEAYKDRFTADTTYNHVGDLRLDPDVYRDRVRANRANREAGGTSPADARALADEQRTLREMMARVKLDSASHQARVSAAVEGIDPSTEAGRKRISDIRKTVSTPGVPAEILPYVDQRALQTAWAASDYEYVLMTYVAGFALWYNSISDTPYDAGVDETYAAISRGTLGEFDAFERERISEKMELAREEQQKERPGKEQEEEVSGQEVQEP